MVTVCAPNHPLDTLRRCRRRRALPACTPPCSAWSATTRWMPQGPEHVPDARRDPHARRVAYLACLRRDLNPRPSVPEADALSTGPRRLVSSAVPTAVHGPDTRRAWNRTTIGIATITRLPPHTLYGQGPHHRTGCFRISTYGRPCARPDHSALQLWTRAPGRIRTCDRTGRNRLL